MLPLSKEGFRSLAERYCVQYGLIARLLRLLQFVHSLDDTDGLSEAEARLIMALEQDLEAQVLSILYPALIDDGLMILPDEKSRTCVLACAN